MKNRKKERDTALDIIRIVALFCVISIHFFWHNGFYSQLVIGKKMWVMFLIRTASSVCVPLFLMLSGYLMCNKKVSSSYYKGLLKTLITYILISLICIVFKKFYFGESFSLKHIIFSILNFSGANYSWYVEMYIGLFLLIPFLNIVYNNLETRKMKKQLIVTFLILTSLPSIINVFNFDMGIQWWKTPVISTAYSQILPDWWTSIYPITYYFIGAFFREIRSELSLKKSTCFAALAFSVIGFGTYNYWRCYSGFYTSGPWADWGALPTVIMTVLMFCFILSFGIKNMSVKVRDLLAKISELCFGAYLCSYIFDSVFYPILNSKVVDMPSRLYYYIIIVPVIFLCSLAVSFLVNCICVRVLKLLSLTEGIKKKNEFTVS